METVLAATHHDPDGRLSAQTLRVLPRLAEQVQAIVVLLTPQTVAESASILRDGGAIVQHGKPEMPIGHAHLGLWRRIALGAAYAAQPEAHRYLFCDLDRVLHWAEFYPDELAAALRFASAYDCVVYGRTPRAFASHPRVQRDTEALANHGFALVSGLNWDVMTAARGLSAAATRLIVTESDDDTVGSDCSWPLLCRQAGLRLGYLETEGMEFETLDRYQDEVAALGGAQAWLDRFDADPRQWLVRIELARAEVAAALRF
ncbi:MAG: hypothetical protein AB4911_13230 [Oscillochloridaceae bacterium umkhey_bin13]